MNYDLEVMANHAKGLVANVRGNLRRSLESIGVVRPRSSPCLARLPPSLSSAALTRLSLCRTF